MSARIRPPWPEERYPTAAEWVDWFLTNTREGQEEIASQSIGDVADINRCLQSRESWINR
jgi:hypothetical protein